MGSKVYTTTMAEQSKRARQNKSGLQSESNLSSKVRGLTERTRRLDGFITKEIRKDENKNREVPYCRREG